MSTDKLRGFRVFWIIGGDMQPQFSRIDFLEETQPHWFIKTFGPIPVGWSMLLTVVS